MIPSRLAFVSVVGFWSTSRQVQYVEWVLLDDTFTCSEKQTPVQGRAACGTVCTAKSIIFFAESITSTTSPIPCFTLTTFSVFFRPAWTSRPICNLRTAGSLCSIAFIWNSNSLDFGAFSLSSRDKIFSYASNNADSSTLRSS